MNCFERVLHLLLVAAFLCVAALPASASPRNDVLVVVNDNSYDSPQIGSYYSQKRNIAPENIVHISVPNQYYIDWTQFKNLRDQILRLGICPSVPSASRPLACTNASDAIYTKENVDLLTANTPIKYIVLTRGIPTRTKVDSLIQDGVDSFPDSTSVDNYLRFWLALFVSKDGVNTLDVSFYDSNFSFKARATAFGDGRGMRIVNPAQDREYIIGRIDGVDLVSSKALVDRALKTEANGYFGKLYASNFVGGAGAEFQWTNYSNDQSIYQPASNNTDYWRYVFGPFGESRTECADYMNNYFSYGQNEPSHLENEPGPGKTPSHCLVQINSGVAEGNQHDGAVPGLDISRQPKAFDAAGYFGSLDGQTISGGFNTLRNWRKDETCTVTLCKDAADPAACQVASTDPFKELNTQCVGVADGFIGYSHRSYPLSILGVWPTAWSSIGVDNNDTPSLRSNDGVNGNYSAWFAQPDDVAGTSVQRLGMRQTIYVNQILASTNYQLSFYVKGEKSAASAKFTHGLEVLYAPDGTIPYPACPYKPSGTTGCLFTDVVTRSVTAPWEMISQDIGAPSIPGWKIKSVTVLLGRGTRLPAGGGLGFDGVSLRDIDNAPNAELLINGSFDQGHQQTSQGDFAANFLSRLGGTAFWGSVAHHRSGGFSFSNNALSTLVYFLKGLPLGDAVWLGDQYNSGIFYGDPLYSPLSVRISNSATNPWNFIPQGVVNLTGSAINGRDSTKVETSYSIEYCKGSDFYLCDTADNPWLTTGISGVAGENKVLGSWDATSLPTGKYVVRLAVTSINSSQNRTQTFFDYWPIATYSATSDFDGDGISDVDALTKYGFDPSNPDMDNDGLSNGNEVNKYQTDPAKPDTDADGLSDGDEVTGYHTDPLKTDTDGDGLSDSNEVKNYHTDPLKTDTDGDGLSDLSELNKYHTDPLKLDTDGDGLNDDVEISVYHTSPFDADTDSDGLSDGDEVGSSTDPLKDTWTGTISGRITSPSGKGIGGLTFWDVSKYPLKITTDENGYFVTRGYVGGETVWFNLFSTNQPAYTFSPSGWDGSAFKHSAGAEVSRNYTATLKTGSIQGKVTLADGTPLAGLTFWDISKYPTTFTTGVDGVFTASGYKAGDNGLFNTASVYGYTLVTTGWSTGTQLVAFQHDGTTKSGLDFVAMPKPDTISGRITTPDGKPVAGLTFWDALKYPKTITTNADGRFVAEGYKSGDSVYLNVFGIPGYALSPINWGGQGFVHKGTAKTGLDFVAVPK